MRCCNLADSPIRALCTRPYLVARQSVHSHSNECMRIHTPRGCPRIHAVGSASRGLCTRPHPFAHQSVHPHSNECMRIHTPRGCPRIHAVGSPSRGLCTRPYLVARQSVHPHSNECMRIHTPRGCPRTHALRSTRTLQEVWALQSHECAAIGRRHFHPRIATFSHFDV